MRQARRQAEDEQHEAEQARQEAEDASDQAAAARQRAADQNAATREALARARQEAGAASAAAGEEAAQAAKARQARARLDEKREAERKAAADAAERERLARLAADKRRQVPLRVLRTGDNHSANLAFSPDGKQIALGIGDEVVLWDLAKGESKTVGKHADYVEAVAFLPDGKGLLSCTAVSVKGWDLAKPGKARFEIKDGRPTLSPASVSADGKQFVLAGSWGQVGRFRDAATGNVLSDPFRDPFRGAATGNAPSEPASADRMVRFPAFVPDGKRVAGWATERNQGKYTEKLTLWDAGTGEKLMLMVRTEHQYYYSVGGAGNIVFSADGRRLASHFCTRSPALQWSVKVWDTKDGKELFATEARQLTSVALSPDGKRVATAGQGGVTVRDVDTGKPVLVFARTEGIFGLAFSPDGRQLAAVVGKECIVWNVLPDDDKAGEK
jgi:WD40 repeat protein